MPMQFEYDDKGTTFYYFLLSFFAMFLIPTTYYMFPDSDKKEEKEENKKPCYCPPCMAKHDILTKTEPRKKTVKLATRAVLILLWALLITGVVKVSQFEKEFSEYNPYDVLKLEAGASKSEIKKAYRELSRELHPDKGGDPVEFMKVAKAYQALTDEEAKENWDKYGNPDGPGATQFGIALPSWIVDKKNSMWVLGVYLIAFVVILPIVVGTWWYRSIQYSSDEVLMDTEQLYWYFLHRTPNMSLKRAIMILAGSFEFEKGHNKEVEERPNDNFEIPQLMRELPQLNEKNKERPLCFPYSVKARALLHAHFSRIALPQSTLSKDLELILKKCPYLIKEMINVIGQLIALGKAGRVAHPPRLDTLENLFKLSQMITQACWDSKSSFLMLPHISQENLRHFSTKKVSFDNPQEEGMFQDVDMKDQRSIKNIRQFIAMKTEERRLLLRTLSDDEYEDVMNVCASYPFLEMEVKIKVIDDEDMLTVTTGSIVTALVMLTRHSQEELLGDDEGKIELNLLQDDSKEDDVTGSPKPVKGWQRKVKKGKGGSKKPVKKQQPKKKKEKVEEEKEEETKTKNDKVKKSKSNEDATGDSDYDFDAVDDLDDDEADDERQQHSDDNDDHHDDDDQDDVTNDAEENEKEWNEIKDDELIQPEKLLEAKSKESHIVHCPYFPVEKHEYWWVYITSKRTNELLTPPQQITNLKEQEEVQLKFTAPEKAGIYQYNVVVRSDSYVDFDTSKIFKVNVSEAKEFDPGAHWDYSSEEEDKDDSGESVYETEDEDDADGNDNDDDASETEGDE